MFNIINSFDTNSKVLVSLVLSVFLTACGAGGSSTDSALSESSGSSVVDNTLEENVESVAPVVISTQPESIIVIEGNAAQFTVDATGGGELNLQWRKNGIELEGETGSSLNFSNTDVSAAGQYSVVVSNAAGSVTSLIALLTVQEIQTDTGGTPIVDETPVVDETPIVEEPVIASVELSWDIPELRDDGSDLALYEINGYIIKYGVDENNLNSTLSVDGATQDSVVIAELNAGTYYFTIATVDSDGLQGAYSEQFEQVIL